MSFGNLRLTNNDLIFFPGEGPSKFFSQILERSLSDCQPIISFFFSGEGPENFFFNFLCPLIINGRPLRAIRSLCDNGQPCFYFQNRHWTDNMH